MDRKQELILAKQLRACRVSILPRVRERRVWVEVDMGKSQGDPKYLNIISHDPVPLKNIFLHFAQLKLQRAYSHFKTQLF